MLCVETVTFDAARHRYGWDAERPGAGSHAERGNQGTVLGNVELLEDDLGLLADDAPAQFDVDRVAVSVFALMY